MLSSHLLKPRHDWTGDIIKLSLVLLLFYMMCLGSYPLFTPDEGRYSEVAREMLATGDLITPRVDGVVFLDKPILYYWLQAAAIYVFGLNEWALRLFPALFGVIGGVVVYVCGRHLFGRLAGLISAGVLATAPLYFGAAHYANLDLEVAVLVSAALLFYLTGSINQDRPSKGFLLGAYISAALAFLTKGMMGVALPIMVIGPWVCLLSRWRSLKNSYLITGALLFFALVLPWYFLVQKANPGFLHYFFITQQVDRFLSSGEFNNPAPWWFYLPIVLLGFSPWTCFLIAAIARATLHVWQARSTRASEIFLLLWIIIVLAFFSIPHSKVMTYILPIFPALALLIGKYMAEDWEQTGRLCLGQACLFIFMSLAFATVFLLTSHYHWFRLPAEFTPYLYTFAAIYLLGAMAACVTLFYWPGVRSLFCIAMVCSLALLSTLTQGAAYLNQNTAKPLAIELNKIIAPQDEVVNYFKFYQDLPVYLKRRITLVANWRYPAIIQNDNWARELWYGMPFQDTGAWLIEEGDFWKRWDSHNRIFVFVNANYFDQFKLHARHYFLLATHNEILLLSNQMNKSTDLVHTH